MGGQWEQAVRLCRYVKSPKLWASLAAMAIQSRSLETVEIALAAIEEVDKLQFVAHIKRLPDEVLRSAELALFCKRPEEALNILKQNKRIYRAIKMNIRLHKWNNALQLALNHQTHVDTVLAYRQQHLEQMNHVETNEEFKKWAQQITVNWEDIKMKIKNEKEIEAGGLLLLFLRSLFLVLRALLLLLRLLPLNGEAQKQAAYGGKLESSLSLPRPVLHALVPSRRCATSLVASCA